LALGQIDAAQAHAHRIAHLQRRPVRCPTSHAAVFELPVVAGMAEICTSPSMGISFSCTNSPNSSALVIVASKVSPTRAADTAFEIAHHVRDASSARRSRCELSIPSVCNSAVV